jgi:penicillin G amidase
MHLFRFALRWLLRITALALFLGVISAVLLGYVLGRSLPDYDEDFTVAGVAAQVEILRDRTAIPHIFGSSEADVFYALGFAHAQDRLWQMMMMRRTAQGRLSEIFGPRTVQIDEVIRRLDIYGAASESVAAQDPSAIAALNAYAAGVNEWITQVNIGARGRGAPEMFLFSSEIAAWAPADSLAIIKLMALQLSSHLGSEVQRAKLSALLPPDRLRDILPDDPSKALGGLPDFANLMDAPLPNLTRAGPSGLASYIDAPLSPFVSAPFAGASNAWAAAAAISADGGSLLANDPHLGLTAPSIWYLARLELPTGGIIGATIPGMPLMLVGRSDNLGWGLTSAYLDDQDVIIERLNPENPDEYMRGGQPKAFEQRQTLLNVKGEAPITLTLRFSDAGPILPPQHYDLGAVTPAGHVAALQWTALSRSDTSLSAGLALMRAQSIAEGIAAGRGYIAPAQNLTLADKTGVAMVMIGAAPRRDGAHATQGRMPSPGWEGANIWNGVLPYESNPRFGSPAQTLVLHTNNKFIDRPFPNHISFDWGDTQRISRALTLMQARAVHTRESFVEAQLDTVSPTARALLPLMGADLWFTAAPSPLGSPERMREDALALLADWNGEMNEHLPEPLISESWLRALQERLIRDELGPLADEFTHPDPVFLERVYRNVDGASVWCDIVQSTAVETCTEIARLALDQALLDLTQRYGPEIISWRWGDAHQAAHDHPVLGNVPVIGTLVNIRQSTSGGDTTLQRGRTKGTGDNPFLNVHGGGYRGVYGFADPDASVFILATGQSGHPLSRHYDDQSELWRRGEYLPMSLDPALARAGSLGSTVLSPPAQ